MFFAPPPRMETEVLARLPDLHRRPRATKWARWKRGGREVDSFLEGPCFDAAGKPYVTESETGSILRARLEKATRAP